MEERVAIRNAVCNGRELDYTVSLEHLPLRDADRRSVGTLSAFSYIADVAADERRERPVLFLTNGGPGAASSYLHLSGIGPLRANVPTELDRGVEPPYGIEASPSSLLDVADLVFLDAPGTGFGTVDDDAELTPFHSMEGDAEAFAAVITEWVARHGRWDSPKYFLGESYGTHRAAFLATASHGMAAMPLNGIALLGQAVNIQETSERPGNVPGALANLPYKAAVAWYHGVGSRDHETVESAIEAALEFAWGDLALAMLQGTALPAADLELAAARVSDMIGIPADELVRSRLWISKTQFRARVLRERGLEVGVNDSRYTAPPADSAVGELGLDASGSHLSPRYTAAFHQLFDAVFGEPATQPYRIYDRGAGRDWEWADQGGAAFLSMGKPSPFHTYPYPARLSRWMKQMPTGRLFIGTGIYDSLTTIGSADHLLRQWDLPRDRVVSHWYDGGHMMYSDPATVAKLNADLRDFVAPERGDRADRAAADAESEER